MKIYTKTGDRGETSLLGGIRVKKSCLEIEAIGEVDELNAVIGVVIAAVHTSGQSGTSLESCVGRLRIVQHRLFTIGYYLADAQMQIGNAPKLVANDIEALENWIDEMESELSPLTQFILPSGHASAAQAFFARALCRRAERRTVAMRELYPKLDPLVPQYLNRLSDALFVLGRWLNRNYCVSETAWQK